MKSGVWCWTVLMVALAAGCAAGPATDAGGDAGGSPAVDGGQQLDAGTLDAGPVDAGAIDAGHAATLLTFGFLPADGGAPVESWATIQDGGVQLFLPPGTPLASLKATFTVSTGAVVSVGGATQQSGTSANDFSAPVSYQVRSGDGAITTPYLVTVITELAAFDGVVQALMSTYGVPGASVAATKDGRLVYLKAYGVQDQTPSKPVTVDSLFRLASVSKPITSAAIFTLVERGQLHLSDKVFGPGALLGTTYGTQPYGPHLTDLTVDQLLHHTSGGWPNDGTDPMFTNPALTAAELITWTLDNRPLTNVPGAAYAYSNFGYCVLGRIIEKVTGKTYEAAVKDLVLTPLGITDMTIGGNTLAERLPGEVRYFGQSSEDPYAFNLRRMDSHGGWVASARSLAVLLVHLDGLTTKADVLTSASITTMTTGSTANPGYACGWQVNSVPNWWHIGSLPGTTTEIIRGANGWNWVLLTNTRSESASFVSDLDSVLWKALPKLTAVPSYDLFQVRP